LLPSNYEGTDLEELARDIGFCPVDQTDAGKLAGEVDQPRACDNGMVSNQKEHRDHTVAVRKVPHGASYENALKGDL
jgi:hypothetical protein